VVFVGCGCLFVLTVAEYLEKKGAAFGCDDADLRRLLSFLALLCRAELDDLIAKAKAGS
jgi:hypothetical protein